MKRLNLSNPRVLRTEEEYDIAAAEIDDLLDQNPEPGTSEHDRLELLTVLVRAYDEENYPVPEVSTPQAVVEFLMEQHGISRAELAPVLGGRSRVSEFFAGKRRLSLSQIQKLRELLKVPADALMESAPV